jgi:uncharacterized SAM-binding protein YcdF (DUF218 family)
MNAYVIEKYKLLCKILFICIFSWLCGLFIFISKIPDSHELDTADTDATVILTGGALRLEEGLKFRSNKILISGIGQGVTRSDLKKTLKNVDLEISDDVILGNIASSTFTNADETKIFMTLHNYKSMRLITSNYHMPRTRLIFSYVMPDIAIIYHPVYSENFRKDGYYISLKSLVMIVNEYNKFCGAVAIVVWDTLEKRWDRAIIDIADWIKMKY